MTKKKVAGKKKASSKPRKVPLAAVSKSPKNNAKVVEAIKKGDAKLLRQLMGEGCSPNFYEKNSTPVHLAVHDNASKLVECLAQFGADLNAPAKNDYVTTPLESAIDYGFAKLVEVLLAHGAETTVKDRFGNSPLVLATMPGVKNHVRIIRSLCEAGANPNANPRILFETVHDLKLEAVEVLLDHGANPNKPVPMGLPLTMAVAVNSVEKAKLLIKHNADPNKKNPKNTGEMSFGRKDVDVSGKSTLELAEELKLKKFIGLLS